MFVGALGTSKPTSSQPCSLRFMHSVVSIVWSKLSLFLLHSLVLAFPQPWLALVSLLPFQVITSVCLATSFQVSATLLLSSFQRFFYGTSFFMSCSESPPAPGPDFGSCSNTAFVSSKLVLKIYSDLGYSATV